MKRIQHSFSLLLIVSIFSLFSHTAHAQTCWKPLGSGIGTAPLSSFGISSFVSYQGKVYAAGGTFDTAGGHPIQGIAVWDGSSWSAVGAGIPNPGLVFAMLVYNGDLYVAGQFDSAGGMPVNNIARWNGSAWSAVGNGIGTGGVDALYTLCVYNDSLYTGGVFGSALSGAGVAKWNGSTWSVVGGGFPAVPGHGIVVGGNVVYSMCVSNHKMYVGGALSTAFSPPAPCYTAIWNDTAWSWLPYGLGDGSPGNDGVTRTMLDYNGELYVGGIFTYAENTGGFVFNLVKWNGANWVGLNSQINGGEIDRLAAYNGKLMVGGSFYVASATDTLRNLAQVVDTTWSSFGGGVNAVVSALDTIGGSLYVGGEFTKAGTVNAMNVAEWSCATGIHDVPDVTSLQIYPNPARTSIEIQTSRNEPIEKSIIYNLTGQKVAEFSSSHMLSVGDLPSGLYVLEVKTNGGIIHANFVKQEF